MFETICTTLCMSREYCTKRRIICARFFTWRPGYIYKTHFLYISKVIYIIIPFFMWLIIKFIFNTIFRKIIKIFYSIRPSSDICFFQFRFYEAKRSGKLKSSSSSGNPTYLPGVNTYLVFLLRRYLRICRAGISA